LGFGEWRSVVPVTNPVTYHEPPQRGFPSPLWDGFKEALGKRPFIIHHSTFCIPLIYACE
jgi:hypothetical protein